MRFSFAFNFIQSHTNELISQVKIRISEKLTQNVGDLNFHCADITLTASKDRLQAMTILEKQTPPLMASVVKVGRTHNHTITVSPMWETTTSAGIPLGKKPLSPR